MRSCPAAIRSRSALSTGGALGAASARQLPSRTSVSAARAAPCSTTSRSWSMCSAVWPITVSTLAAVSASSGLDPGHADLVIEESHSSSSR